MVLAEEEAVVEVGGATVGPVAWLHEEGSAIGPYRAATFPAMGYRDFGSEMPDSVETETCVGCGLTVEVDSPAFLEWEADIVGWSTCPDCGDLANDGDAPEAAALPDARQRAA